jgi:hypothetical protein
MKRTVDSFRDTSLPLQLPANGLSQSARDVRQHPMLNQGLLGDIVVSHWYHQSFMGFSADLDFVPAALTDPDLWSALASVPSIS